MLAGFVALPSYSERVWTFQLRDLLKDAGVPGGIARLRHDPSESDDEIAGHLQSFVNPCDLGIWLIPYRTGRVEKELRGVLVVAIFRRKRYVDIAIVAGSLQRSVVRIERGNV